MKYVIEKMVEDVRFWFDGDGWTDADTDAKWYDARFEAEKVSDKIGGDVTGFEI